MVYQLMYYSTACQEQSDAQLRNILEVSRQSNRERDVTGLLLYGDGVFFQVLEGAEADVRALYAKIEADDRHHSLLEAVEREVPQRSFGEWAMGYTSLNGEIRAGVNSLMEAGERHVGASGNYNCDPLVRLLVESFINNQQLT